MNEQKRIDQLRRAVVEQANPPNLDALLPKLDAYVAAQLHGDDYAADFADVALLLDQSPQLSSIYARVYDAAVAEEAAANIVIPTPDLSFLTPKVVVADMLRDAITTTGNKVRLALSDALLSLFAPPPSPALAVRGAADKERYNTEILKLEQDIFALSAWLDSADASLCLVEVTVEPEGKMWPELAGSTVTITVNDAVLSETTDEWGIVAFEGVKVANLGALVVEIELAE